MVVYRTDTGQKGGIEQDVFLGTRRCNSASKSRKEMAMRLSLYSAIALSLLLMCAGCDSEQCDEDSSAKSDGKAILRGLQGIASVQLRMSDALGVPSDPFQTNIARMLAERLPALNTNGGPEDWVLEIEKTYTGQVSPYSSIGDFVATPTYRLRVWKPAVIDGRAVTVTAYEMQAVGQVPFPSSRQAATHDFVPLMEAFAEQWREDNPSEM